MLTRPAPEPGVAAQEVQVRILSDDPVGDAVGTDAAGRIGPQGDRFVESPDGLQRLAVIPTTPLVIMRLLAHFAGASRSSLGDRTGSRWGQLPVVELAGVAVHGSGVIRDGDGIGARGVVGEVPD